MRGGYMLEVPYPELLEREIRCRFDWVSKRWVEHHKLRNDYRFLMYEPLEQKYALPEVIGNEEVTVEILYQFTLMQGIKHTYTCRIPNLPPGLQTSEWTTVYHSCLRIYRAHQYVPDRVFTCQCGVRATIASVDARWVEHHGYWMCGPCRDVLQDAGFSDWDPP